MSAPALDEIGLIPAIHPDMESLLDWLNFEGLTDTVGGLDRSPDDALPGAATMCHDPALGNRPSRRPTPDARLTEDPQREL